MFQDFYCFYLCNLTSTFSQFKPCLRLIQGVRFYSHKLLVNGKNTVPPRVYGNRLTAYQVITSRYSTCILTLILPQHIRKSLTYKAFLNPFRYKVSRLLPAKLHTQRFAVAVSFRRKLLTLRQLSHGHIIYFYFADASARTSSDTAST